MARHTVTIERKGPSRADMLAAAAAQQAQRDRETAEIARLERMAREQAKAVLNPPDPMTSMLRRIGALEADLRDVRAELSDLRGAR